jgi:osmoprotectant transport system substrate-binding protein
MTTEELIELNAAVDLERQSAEDVAAAWVEENVDTAAAGAGQRPDRGRRCELHRVHRAGERLRRRPHRRRVRRLGREVGNRELYLPALISGSEIQVFRSTWPR